MSEVIHCNECDGQRREDLAYGWLHIERNNTLLSYSADPGPWDFCSWACVHEYGERKSSKEPRGSNGSGVAYHDQETIWGPLRSGDMAFNTKEHERYVEEMRVYSNRSSPSADQSQRRTQPGPRGRDLPSDTPLQRLSQALRRAGRLRRRDVD